jgi:hyperosmotically inducible periplasmic protein
MKQRILTVLMVISLAFAAGAVALANGKSDTKRQNTTQSSQPGDQVIAKEVRHELVMLPYYTLFDWLEYQVEEGIVKLSGQVVRPTLKSDAESVVGSIKGVDKVINQIEVLPLSPLDDQIRLRVARAIFNFGTPLYRYGLQAVPSIHIIVKNGNVTLKGIVDSQADSNLANIKANGVSNVFSVRNELQVAGKSGT